MRDARKLFRLFKSVNEAHKILEILNKGGADQLEVALNLLNRFAFLLYWIFDNIAILGSIKFLSVDSKKNSKYGAFFWFWALIFSLITAFKKMSELNNREKLEKASQNPENKESVQKRLEKINNDKKDQYLNIIKNLGDLITASQGSEIFPKLTGRSFTDGWIGAGGFVSAVITSYQLY